MKPALTISRRFATRAARVAMLLPLALLLPGEGPSADPACGTFSIIGFDPATREIGVAVQSRAFNVGHAVPWARAGVGAVATQAWTNQSFGPRGLEMMAAGMNAAETLQALVASDSNRAVRQLGVMDGDGRCATWTGNDCLDWAGGLCEPRMFVCQGNILAGHDVVTAMARAFRTVGGDLSDRLLAALDSAQAAGGDRRGKQSAALLVVRPSETHPQYETRYVDLRVDDHPEPIRELRRLYEIFQATDLLGAHLDYLEEYERAGERRLAKLEKTRIRGMLLRALARPGDANTLNALAWECATRDLYLDDAVRAARRAVALDPQNANILDTLAEALYRNGHAAEAIEIESSAAAIDPSNDYLKRQIARFRSGR